MGGGPQPCDEIEKLHISYSSCLSERATAAAAHPSMRRINILEKYQSCIKATIVMGTKQKQQTVDLTFYMHIVIKIRIDSHKLHKRCSNQEIGFGIVSPLRLIMHGFAIPTSANSPCTCGTSRTNNDKSLPGSANSHCMDPPSTVGKDSTCRTDMNLYTTRQTKVLFDRKAELLSAASHRGHEWLQPNKI